MHIFDSCWISRRISFHHVWACMLERLHSSFTSRKKLHFLPGNSWEFSPVLGELQIFHDEKLNGPTQILWKWDILNANKTLQSRAANLHRKVEDDRVFRKNNKSILHEMPCWAPAGLPSVHFFLNLWTQRALQFSALFTYYLFTYKYRMRFVKSIYSASKSRIRVVLNCKRCECTYALIGFNASKTRVIIIQYPYIGDHFEACLRTTWPVNLEN